MQRQSVEPSSRSSPTKRLQISWKHYDAILPYVWSSWFEIYPDLFYSQQRKKIKIFPGFLSPVGQQKVEGSAPSLVCINLPRHGENIISLWNLNSLQNNLRKFPPIKIYLFLFYHQQRKHISTVEAGNLDRRLFFHRKTLKCSDGKWHFTPTPSCKPDWELVGIVFSEDSNVSRRPLGGDNSPPPAGRSTQTPGAGARWYCQSG